MPSHSSMSGLQVFWMLPEYWWTAFIEADKTSILRPLQRLVRCLRVQSDFHKGYTLGRMTCATMVWSRKYSWLMALEIRQTGLHSRQNLLFFLHSDIPLLHFLSCRSKRKLQLSEFQKENTPKNKTFIVDEHRLQKRQKQIDFGKNTLAYGRYIDAVKRYGLSKTIMVHVHHFKVSCAGGGSIQFPLDHIGHNDSYTKSYARMSPIK